VMGCCGHGNERSGSIKLGGCLTSLGTVSFSGRTLLPLVSQITVGELNLWSAYAMQAGR
jgi:hypothetical protein